MIMKTNSETILNAAPVNKGTEANPLTEQIDLAMEMMKRVRTVSTGREAYAEAPMSYLLPQPVYLCATP